MPAPEQGGGKGPERQKGRAVPPPPQAPAPQPQQEPWYRAARYAAEPPSARAYFQAQETLYQSEEDLSAYRLMLEHIYHVAVLGGAPTEAAMQEQIEQILYAEGTPTQLPDEVLVYLFERREKEIQKGPWTEGHYRPGRVVDLRKKGKRRKR
jgi:hypothetical protein